MMGGQVVILRTHGHLDMEVVSKTIHRHQVTYLGTVPSQMIELAKLLVCANDKSMLKSVRCVSTGGRPTSVERAKTALYFYPIPNRRDAIHQHCDCTQTIFACIVSYL
jgi:acyl-coenzyme A synthetase/AMP-(fatty) acid ligase